MQGITDMADRYIAYVDETDGNDRESWSVFYGAIFVGDTEAEAKTKAEAYLKAQGGFGEIHVRKADG
jgi:hypothetical protein